MNMKVMCVSTIHPRLFSSFCISGSEGGLAICGHGKATWVLGEEEEKKKEKEK